MPPELGLAIYVLGIVALFLLERDRTSHVSAGLWIPSVWLAIASSRPIGYWLGLGPSVKSPDQLLEGSPFDRVILAGLLLAGLCILAGRRRTTARFLRANSLLLVFFLYAAFSLLWSEYPYVAFKRWVRAVGDPVMILVVLTESNPSAAIKRLFTRIGFVLLPISLPLINYYPAIGREYHRWSGQLMVTGVASGKTASVPFASSSASHPCGDFSTRSVLWKNPVEPDP